jgi:hypothetical protein
MASATANRLRITQVTTVADTTTELLAIVLLLAATIHALVRRPILGFVGAWFFIILAPTSSLIPLLGEVATERRMYLLSMALLTLSVVLVWLVLQRFSLQRIAPVVLAVAGLAFFGRHGGTQRKLSQRREHLEVRAGGAP